MSSKLVQLKNKEGENITPAIGGNQLAAVVPLNLGGTGSTMLGQQVGLIAYGNNGSSLETIGTQDQGFLYSSGGGRSLPDFVNIADYIVEQGTSGIWTYEKWNSGKMVAWNVGRRVLPATNNGTNSLGYNRYSNIALPTDMTAVDTISGFATPSTETGANKGGTLSSWQQKNNSLVIYASGDSDGLYITCSLTLIGKWK